MGCVWDELWVIEMGPSESRSALGCLRVVNRVEMISVGHSGTDGEDESSQVEKTGDRFYKSIRSVNEQLHV